MDLSKHDGFNMFYSNIMGYTVTRKEIVGDVGVQWGSGQIRFCSGPRSYGERCQILKWRKHDRITTVSGLVAVLATLQVL